MSVDLSRAKRVAWVTWDGIIVLASREGPQESFKSEDTGNIYPQSQVEEFLGARAIEEFPPSPLEEAIGDAPAFQHTRGIVKRVWVRRDDSTWGAVNVGYLDYGGELSPYVKRTYTITEMEEFLTPDNVIPLYPD